MTIISFIFIILQVIILDGILSIDNAAALGAIASRLSKEQQKSALRYGILGAYIGRGLMLLFAGIIISLPFLKFLGAVYLLYLVGGHFFGWSGLQFNISKGASNFWRTVLLIELADLAFSIDNVMAVVAISQYIWVIILGVCLSILIMRFAASLFIKLIEFEPLLEHAAFVLILAIAIEMLLKLANINIGEIVQFSISIIILLAFILVGQVNRRVWKIKN